MRWIALYIHTRAYRTRVCTRATDLVVTVVTTADSMLLSPHFGGVVTGSDGVLGGDGVLSGPNVATVRHLSPIVHDLLPEQEVLW